PVRHRPPPAPGRNTRRPAGPPPRPAVPAHVPHPVLALRDGHRAHAQPRPGRIPLDPPHQPAPHTHPPAAQRPRTRRRRPGRLRTTMTTLKPVARRALLAAFASQGHTLRRTRGGFVSTPVQVKTSTAV